MALYILKSSACLLVLLLFYKLFLEKQSIHNFKRFYLLISVFISFLIPLISVFHKPVYAAVFTNLNTINPFLTNNQNIEQTPNYLSVGLFLMYLLGVLFFLSRFTINLLKIGSVIKNNEQVKQNKYNYVLISQKIIPYTFFNYIFINKEQFLANKIPKEVLLHEQIHADQKHSLDIIVIEILILAFWFNPLLFFLKRYIKLNHEFIADRGVIYKGISTKKYQETLLEFSSKIKLPVLVNPINYSSLKKRFTVMKTKTSNIKTKFIISSLIPLLALLLVSFGKNQNIHSIGILNNSLEKKHTEQQNKATKEQIKQYNSLAKKYNAMENGLTASKINENEYDTLKKIYGIMTLEQRKNAEPFPNFPEQLPLKNRTINSSKDKLSDKGYITINGETCYYIKKNGKTIYYTKYGKQIDKNGNPIKPE